MTWWVWVVVVVIMAAMFGLGCIAARAGFIKNEGRLVSNRRADTILGVFFTVVALAVAADTIHLQVQYNRDTRGRVECNSRAVDASAKVVSQRMEIDRAAANFDAALSAYLAAHTRRLVPDDDPLYLHLQDTIRDVGTERVKMLQAYADNPVTRC